MSEKDLKWFPIQGIPFLLDLDKYQRNEHGLSIYLNSEYNTGKILSIHFAECEVFREMGMNLKPGSGMKRISKKIFLILLTTFFVWL
jgi:hypothetical protein